MSDGPRIEAVETEQERTNRELARQALEIREFKRDPYWAIQKGYVWTQDEHAPKGTDPRKQMPDRDYMKAIMYIVQGSRVGMIMKSRQIMMSWLFCWWLLHGAISIDGALCVAQGKREEDVSAKGDKGLMGRMRFMRKNLPPHLQPILAEKEAKTTEVYKNGSTLMVIPQGEDIIRSLTLTRCLMDELSRHPKGEKAWNAALATTRGGGQLWGVSTPNGREFCYQQADKRLPWDDWKRWPMVMDGLYGYQNSNGVHLVALHFTADQAACTPEAQEERRLGYTNANQYRQENDLDFSMQPGEAVYGEFDEGVHVISKYVVNRSVPIYLGWDFGYTGTAVGFYQHNHQGQLVWFDLIFYQRVPLPRICQEVQARLMSILGDNAKEKLQKEVPLHDLEGKPIPDARALVTQQASNVLDVLHYGDPSANTHNTKGETDRSTLAGFGFNLRTKVTAGRKMDLVEQPRALLLRRSDGTPGFLIAAGPSADMRLAIEGFKGGYHYPERQTGRADKQLPEKDGFYDHIFDQFQYMIDNVRPIRAALLDEGGGGDWWKDSSWSDNPFADTAHDGFEQLF